MNVRAKTLAACCRIVANALRVCARTLEADAAVVPEQPESCATLFTNPRATYIAEQVALEYVVTVPGILGRRKHKAVTTARHVLWYLLQREGMGYKHIGELTGYDHTSVYNGVKRVKAYEFEQATRVRKLQDAVSFVREKNA